MALHIRSDGKTESVAPANGKHFTLEELYRLCNCDYIQIVMTTDNRLMIVDESARLKQNQVINRVATQLYPHSAWTPILGDVVICDRSEVQ